jgi:hypothetical protein
MGDSLKEVIKTQQASCQTLQLFHFSVLTDSPAGQTPDVGACMLHFEAHGNARW